MAAGIIQIPLSDTIGTGSKRIIAPSYTAYTTAHPPKTIYLVYVSRPSSSSHGHRLDPRARRSQHSTETHARCAVAGYEALRLLPQRSVLLPVALESTPRSAEHGLEGLERRQLGRTDRVGGWRGLKGEFDVFDEYLRGQSSSPMECLLGRRGAVCLLAQAGGTGGWGLHEVIPLPKAYGSKTHLNLLHGK